MTAKVKKDFNDPDMTFVYPDVQGRLAPLVACIEVSVPPMQQTYDFRFVSEGSVVHGAVSVLILRATIQCTSVSIPEYQNTVKVLKLLLKTIFKPLNLPVSM